MYEYFLILLSSLEYVTRSKTAISYDNSTPSLWGVAAPWSSIFLSSWSLRNSLKVPPLVLVLRYSEITALEPLHQIQLNLPISSSQILTFNFFIQKKKMKLTQKPTYINNDMKTLSPWEEGLLDWWSRNSSWKQEISWIKWKIIKFMNILKVGELLYCNHLLEMAPNTASMTVIIDKLEIKKS